MNKKRLLAVAVSGTLLSGMIVSTMQSAIAADANAATQISNQATATPPPQYNTAAPDNTPANTQAAAAVTPPNTAAAGNTPANMQPTAVPNTTQANSQAATTSPQAKPAGNEQTAEKDWLKVSDDAMTSMYDLHGARHAIFNGNPAQARTFLDAAVTRINAASKDAQQYALDVKAPKPEDQYIPFSTSLNVLDTIKPTDTKAEHLAKANDHLQKGEQKKAMEELKISEVDATITTSLLPVNFAKAQITQAAELARKGQYYEANLALKAVDDSILLQVFDLNEAPEVINGNGNAAAATTNQTPPAPTTIPAQQG